jgi:hypothetical protein
MMVHVAGAVNQLEVLDPRVAVVAIEVMQMNLCRFCQV